MLLGQKQESNEEGSCQKSYQMIQEEEFCKRRGMDVLGYVSPKKRMER